MDGLSLSRRPTITQEETYSRKDRLRTFSQTGTTLHLGWEDSIIPSASMTLLIIIIPSILISVSVFYGIQDDSSKRRRKRKARRRDRARNAAEQSRKVDAERNSSDGKTGSLDNDDAVKNWTGLDREGRD